MSESHNSHYFRLERTTALSGAVDATGSQGLVVQDYYSPYSGFLEGTYRLDLSHIINTPSGMQCEDIW